ncbi:MAG: DNA repair protein RecO [Bacteroidetes bacterium]|nr:DNA repair protein RecO [Bacteroidota bacterium]
MISATPSIVLRSLKYGETSLISTQFTRAFGVQSYLLKGIRSLAAKGRSSRAGLLQPAMILELEAYHRPQGNLQNLKEFAPIVFYKSLQEEVVKNSIALFSAELLLCLLPEAVPMPPLFDFSKQYLEELDWRTVDEVANFPLFFALQCGRALGFEIAGRCTEQNPYISLEEGAFVPFLPAQSTVLQAGDAVAMDQLIQCGGFDSLPELNLNGATRNRLLEWYLAFLQRHTGHMRPLKSLKILTTILHDFRQPD